MNSRDQHVLYRTASMGPHKGQCSTKQGCLHVPQGVSLSDKIRIVPSVLRRWRECVAAVWPLACTAIVSKAACMIQRYWGELEA